MKISEIKFHNYKIILQKVKELIDECDETAANDGTGKQRQTGLTPTKNHYCWKIVVSRRTWSCAIISVQLFIASLPGASLMNLLHALINLLSRATLLKWHLDNFWNRSARLDWHRRNTKLFRNFYCRRVGKIWTRLCCRIFF